MPNPLGGRAREPNGVGLVLLALIVGCGRGGLDAPEDPGGPSLPAESGVPVGSGIPAATRVASLSDAQRRSLCDFVAGRQGGYNHTVQCASREAMTDVDQSQCAEALTAIGGLCPTLTVGAIDDCVAGPDGNICTFETAPECRALLACINSI